MHLRPVRMIKLSRSPSLLTTRNSIVPSRSSITAGCAIFELTRVQRLQTGKKVTKGTDLFRVRHEFENLLLVLLQACYQLFSMTLNFSRYHTESNLIFLAGRLRFRLFHRMGGINRRNPFLRSLALATCKKFVRKLHVAGSN